MRPLSLVLVVLSLFGAPVALAQPVEPVPCDPTEEECETFENNLTSPSKAASELTLFDEVKATTKGPEMAPTAPEADWLKSQSFGSDSLFDITR